MRNVALKETISRLLPRVQTPAQYLGGELNSVVKDHRHVRGKLCLAFPDTYTLGMIWQPAERGVSLTADLYQIEIEDVVDSLGFLTAYQQCFNVNGQSNPTYSVANEFCQAIHRDPITSNAGYVEGGNFNLSKRFTQGLDVSLNWRKDMAGGVFGNIIAPGGSKTLGTILGAGAGALIGRAIDDGVECR